MARAFVRARIRKPALIAAAILMLAPVPAWAIMTVFDPQAFSRLGEQVTKLQKQFEELQKETRFLGEISGKAQDQIDAIGQVGRVALPAADLETLARQVRRDARCLLPDLKRLMPSLDQKALAWTSLCARRGLYEKQLWFEAGKAETWDLTDDDGRRIDAGEIDMSTPEGRKRFYRLQDRQRLAVESVRRAMARDAIDGGLARSDAQAVERMETAEKAADALEEQADAAADLKGELAAANKLLALLARQQAQTNQQLALMIKIQALTLMEFEPASEDARAAAKAGGAP